MSKENFKGVVGLHKAQYEELVANGTVTLDTGEEIKYEPSNTVYMVDDDDSWSGDIERLEQDITDLQANDTVQDLTLTSLTEQSKDFDTKINTLETARSDFELELGGLQRDKQDKLTAGEGINIDNNVISAVRQNGLSPYVSRLRFVETKNETIEIDIVESSNFLVDWGDGTSTLYTELINKISHEYGETSSRDIIIFGDWNGLAERTSTTAPTFLKKIGSVTYGENIGELKAYALAGCESLTTFYCYGKVVGGYYFILNGNAFRNCKNFRYLFSLNPIYSYSSNTFTNCSSEKFNIEASIYAMANPQFVNSTIPPYFKFVGGGSLFMPSIYLSAFTNCKNPPTRVVFEVLLNDSILSLNTNTENTSANDKLTGIDTIKILTRANSMSISTLGNNRFLKGEIKTLILQTAPVLDKDYGKSDYIHRLNSAPKDENQCPETILVSKFQLKNTKLGTNWTVIANHIYPIGGVYEETVTITPEDWGDTNEATVQVIGATSEDRNILEYTLVDDTGKSIEDTYGIEATAQGNCTMTFKCATKPEADIKLFIKSTLQHDVLE